MLSFKLFKIVAKISMLSFVNGLHLLNHCYSVEGQKMWCRGRTKSNLKFKTNQRKSKQYVVDSCLCVNACMRALKWLRKSKKHINSTRLHDWQSNRTFHLPWKILVTSDQDGLFWYLVFFYFSNRYDRVGKGSHLKQVEVIIAAFSNTHTHNWVLFERIPQSWQPCGKRG